jgi:hypothetical protein
MGVVLFADIAGDIIAPRHDPEIENRFAVGDLPDRIARFFRPAWRPISRDI